VELWLYRPTSTSGVLEYWNGSAWGTAITNLSATLTPVGGSSSVSWNRSSGWPSSTLPDGIYYLRAWAYDRAGKSANVISSFRKVTSAGASVRAASVTPTQLNVTLSSVEALVSSQGLKLTFTGALNQAVAENVSNYSISVSGRAVVAQAVVYDVATHTVVLLLPEGSMKAGNQVTVRWSLRDAAGALVSGQTDLQAE
jgi:hypothetical protein